MAQATVNGLSTLAGGISAVFSFAVWRGPVVLWQEATEFLGGIKEESHAAADESELAKRMGEGDDQAFELLYEKYFQPVYGFIVKRVGHRETAEDIASQVFMKAFAHRKTFVLKTSFSAWIYRIATNALTDHYRKKKPETEFVENVHENASNDSPAESMDIAWLRGELEAVLVRLNERERLAVTLKYYGELGNHEIAEVIGCTANNLGVILHRALKKCEHLAPERLKSMMHDDQYVAQQSEK